MSHKLEPQSTLYFWSQTTTPDDIVDVTLWYTWQMTAALHLALPKREAHELIHALKPHQIDCPPGLDHILAEAALNGTVRKADLCKFETIYYDGYLAEEERKNQPSPVEQAILDTINNDEDLYNTLRGSWLSQDLAIDADTNIRDLFLSFFTGSPCHIRPAEFAWGIYKVALMSADWASIRNMFKPEEG